MQCKEAILVFSVAMLALGAASAADRCVGAPVDKPPTAWQLTEECVAYWLGTSEHALSQEPLHNMTNTEMARVLPPLLGGKKPGTKAYVAVAYTLAMSGIDVDANVRRVLSILDVFGTNADVFDSVAAGITPFEGILTLRFTLYRRTHCPALVRRFLLFRPSRVDREWIRNFRETLIPDDPGLVLGVIERDPHLAKDMKGAVVEYANPKWKYGVKHALVQLSSDKSATARTWAASCLDEIHARWDNRKSAQTGTGP